MTEQEALRHKLKINYKDDLSGVKYIRVFLKYSEDTSSSLLDSLNEWEKDPLIYMDIFNYYVNNNPETIPEFINGSRILFIHPPARIKVDLTIDYLEIVDLNNNKRI
jgi:hypothetical protein